MTSSSGSGFRLLAEANTPTVIGKAWWSQSLQLSRAGDVRRLLIGGAAAFVGLQMVGGVCAVAGAIVNGGSDDGASNPDVRREKRDALALQRQYGWNFGAVGESATMPFEGGHTGLIDRASIERLAVALAPKNPSLMPLYVPTLFQAITARPTNQTHEEARNTGFVSLADVLTPMTTPAMGQAMSEATLLKTLLGDSFEHTAVVVDLDGPASVAFAAELSNRFDPVFCFDNWPHPRGVVRAHETLAAAATLLPTFEQNAVLRPQNAPPVFVLDRRRLTPYVDEENTFDNRSVARLPGADVLMRLGIKRVFYIAPDGASVVDLDDVNEDLVVWHAAAGIPVRTVDFDDWRGINTETAAATFAAQYGVPPPAGASPTPTRASSWTPASRTSPYVAHSRPPVFGQVPVVVDIAAGAVLGSVLYRSGSWNRVSSSSSSWSFGGG
jgi:hypothetical protein